MTDWWLAPRSPEFRRVDPHADVGPSSTTTNMSTFAASARQATSLSSNTPEHEGIPLDGGGDCAGGLDQDMPLSSSASPLMFSFAPPAEATLVDLLDQIKQAP